MASSMALKRGPVSTLLSKLVNLSQLRTVSVATPTVSRSFSTNAQVTNFDQNDRSVDFERQPDRSVSRHRDSPRLFSDVFDPFSPTRSLSQVLNLMDQFTDHPFLSSPNLITSRKGWDMREDNDALSFRIEMPGLSKEDVKIEVDQNTLIIRGGGGGGKDLDEEDGGRRYSSRLDLPPNMYKFGEIKAEMKNGVLKVVVPKVKEEERRNVYQVTVE